MDYTIFFPAVLTQKPSDMTRSIKLQTTIYNFVAPRPCASQIKIVSLMLFTRKKVQRAFYEMFTALHSAHSAGAGAEPEPQEHKNIPSISAVKSHRLVKKGSIINRTCMYKPTILLPFLFSFTKYCQIEVSFN